MEASNLRRHGSEYGISVSLTERLKARSDCTGTLIALTPSPPSSGSAATYTYSESITVYGCSVGSAQITAELQGSHPTKAPKAARLDSVVLSVIVTDHPTPEPPRPTFTPTPTPTPSISITGLPAEVTRGDSFRFSVEVSRAKLGFDRVHLTLSTHTSFSSNCQEDSLRDYPLNTASDTDREFTAYACSVGSDAVTADLQRLPEPPAVPNKMRIDSDSETISVVPPAPLAPTGFAAEALSNTSIRLTWNRIQGVTYNLQREIDMPGQMPIPLLTGSSASTYTATGLQCGTEYKFRLVARGDELTYRGFSGGVYLTGTTCPPDMSAPALTPGARRLGVDWSALTAKATVTHYQVRHRRQSLGASWSQRTVLTGTSTTIAGLIAGNPYEVQVRACIGSDCGNWSNTSVGTPTDADPTPTPTPTPIPTETLSVSDASSVRVGSSISLDVEASHLRRLNSEYGISVSLSPHLKARSDCTGTSLALTPSPPSSGSTATYTYRESFTVYGCSEGSAQITVELQGSHPGTPKSARLDEVVVPVSVTRQPPPPPPGVSCPTHTSFEISVPRDPLTGYYSDSVQVTFAKPSNSRNCVYEIRLMHLRDSPHTGGPTALLDGNALPAGEDGVKTLTPTRGAGRYRVDIVGCANTRCTSRTSSNTVTKLAAPIDLDVTPTPGRQADLTWRSGNTSAGVFQLLIEGSGGSSGARTITSGPHKERFDLDGTFNPVTRVGRGIIGAQGLDDERYFTFSIREWGGDEHTMSSDYSVVTIVDTPITAINGYSPGRGKARLSWDSISSALGDATYAGGTYSFRYREVDGHYSQFTWFPRVYGTAQTVPESDLVGGNTIAHPDHDLTKGAIYAIQLVYEQAGKPTVYAARDAYVWVSGRSAANTPARQGERVATFPLNFPWATKQYAYRVCEETFPEGRRAAWSKFITHAISQWDLATNGLVTTQRLNRLCAQYEPFVNDVVAQVERFAQSGQTAAQIEAHAAMLLDNFEKAHVDSLAALDELDARRSEVFMVDDTAAIPAGVFSEISTRVGYGWCRSGDNIDNDNWVACAPPSLQPTHTVDILLRASKFRGIDLSVPGGDDRASAREIPFNSCEPVAERYGTLVHEAGHALGITNGKDGVKQQRHHSNIFDSVMYTYRNRATTCSPTPFDVLAIYALYQGRQ